MAHPLDGARKRIERADKHLDDFISEVEAYAASEAKNIAIEYDEVRNQPNVILAASTPLPDEMALVVSDCIHNLRAALDYLVFELAREDSSDPEPERTQFPVFTDPDDFLALRKARAKGKGYFRYLSSAHIDAIEAYQPYKGINWTQTLVDISNPDKHRKLTRTRSGRRTHITNGRGEVFKGVGPHRTDVRMERRVSVRVFFGDKRPVLETLEILKREIALVIDSFSPEFKV
jgi:hypothetical protein